MLQMYQMLQKYQMLQMLLPTWMIRSSCSRYGLVASYSSHWKWCQFFSCNDFNKIDVNDHIDKFSQYKPCVLCNNDANNYSHPYNWHYYLHFVTSISPCNCLQQLFLNFLATHNICPASCSTPPPSWSLSQWFPLGNSKGTMIMMVMMMEMIIMMMMLMMFLSDHLRMVWIWWSWPASSKAPWWTETVMIMTFLSKGAIHP